MRLAHSFNNLFQRGNMFQNYRGFFMQFAIVETANQIQRRTNIHFFKCCAEARKYEKSKIDKLLNSSQWHHLTLPDEPESTKTSCPESFRYSMKPPSKRYQHKNFSRDQINAMQSVDISKLSVGKIRSAGIYSMIQTDGFNHDGSLAITDQSRMISSKGIKSEWRKVRQNQRSTPFEVQSLYNFIPRGRY